MNKRLFAVIHNSSVNEATGFRKLVGERDFGRISSDLIIEIIAEHDGRYIPVNEAVRAMFPVIKREFIERLIVQY